MRNAEQKQITQKPWQIVIIIDKSLSNIIQIQLEEKLYFPVDK